MILIQVVLVLGFLLLLFGFLANPTSYQTRAWIKISGVLFTMIAITVVIFPNLSDDVAHWLGVKYGANLLLYLLTLAYIFSALTIYTRSKQEQKRFVGLARKVALLEADLQKLKANNLTGDHHDKP